MDDWRYEPMAATPTDRAEAVTERVLGWEPGHGLTVMAEGSGGPAGPGGAGAAGGTLPAADSWLVTGGRVRALARHRERFLRACAETVELPHGQLAAFWQDMTAALPREGAWFPRVELAPPGRTPLLRLRLRAAPPLTSQVRVWAQGQPDPRTVPRRKGPDLDTLAEVRRRAAAHGADEALLTSASGLVLEAAYSSVMWWEEDTLCVPSPALPVLAGVTTAVIRERARRARIPFVACERTVADLEGREVWLVNALHGIRPVTAWTGRPMRAGEATRAPEWREWLAGITEPLPVDWP
ncbi:aminotransferase class IV [Streptomyces sp. NPDC096310]|uniref:aminotransferase class IV n=1 Tax=Streptomyces sp. NPDC096310 TaxID=3366082 RepID=UPI003827DA8F